MLSDRDPTIMLARDMKRFLPFLVPAVLVVWFVTTLYGKTWVPVPSTTNLSPAGSSSKSEAKTDAQHIGHRISGYKKGVYREILSVSAADKKYFNINFDPHPAINPNAIPHPTLENTWIIVAQRGEHYVKDSVWFTELMCNAVFKGGELSCTQPPLIMPVGRTYVRLYYQHWHTDRKSNRF